MKIPTSNYGCGLDSCEACYGDAEYKAGRMMANSNDPDASYSIVRFYRDKPSEIIESGLTLEEAQEHCNSEDTRGDDWFDGYTED